MTVTDRTDATEQEFRSRIAPFESAPTPPEVREAAVLEEVARALYGAAGYEAPSWRPMCDDLDEVREQTWLALAAAAVAAYRATQDGGAEEAVRRVEALAKELDSAALNVDDSDFYRGAVSGRAIAAARLRAALAPQAGEARQ